MQWLVSKEPVLPCDSHVTVGVVMDSDHAFSVLDMGPAADSKQVSQYSTFNFDLYFLSFELSVILR